MRKCLINKNIQKQTQLGSESKNESKSNVAILPPIEWIKQDEKWGAEWPLGAEQKSNGVRTKCVLVSHKEKLMGNGMQGEMVGVEGSGWENLKDRTKMTCYLEDDFWGVKLEALVGLLKFQK